jgi:hypothetical protein
MAARINHQDLVKKLIENKSVDFKAIGQTVAELGPSLAMADDPWDVFCGTMRTFIHLYVLPHGGNPVENLNQLRGIAGEIKG